ncbi:flagellar filament capping protein FliD [Clostridium butyricum]|uniref:flagellar filament capping protein FliD n=1 Tax=Clostridium butyricum TaxID=1492 RepID=UPI0022E2CCE2|nr:flagellar filament capping protein FliD [Clostridium butyricum]
MTNRITGTNSGIDVEAVVKASLTTEQNKIDKAYQQQMVYEYQQEQLREIVDKCTDFYDKYLDILSSNSLMKSSAYESVSFTGDNNNVVAKGYAGADASEYTVEVTSLASKATATIDGTKATATISAKSLTSTSKISVNGVEFTDIKSNADGNVNITETVKALNEQLSSSSSNVRARYDSSAGGIVIDSIASGKNQTFTLSVDGTNQKVTSGTGEKGLNSGDKIFIAGMKDEDAVEVVTTDEGVVDLSATAKALNQKISSQGLTAKYSELSGGIVIESTATGESQNFTLSIKSKTDNYNTEVYNIEGKGKDASFTITKDGLSTTKTSSTNTVIVDNIEFTANKVGSTTLSGKNDGTKLKDTIVNFINDYNKLITTINEKLLETRDRNYPPLTEEQKADMTESEIEKWEEKAKAGLLKNDKDLVRIQSALKESMRTFMSGSGLNLQEIGIKPVDNYGSKNGTFTIDEDRLSKAIEENAEGVKDLFIKSADSTASTNAKGGILTQLQSILKNETKSSSSILSKRIGFTGTSTENSNTFKTNITKQKKLISELKEKYTTRETALYKKYSSLETMLEKLNAQSSSLYSMLNIG